MCACIQYTHHNIIYTNIMYVMYICIYYIKCVIYALLCMGVFIFSKSTAARYEGWNPVLVVLVKSILRIFRAIQGIAKCSAFPSRPCRLLLKMLHISDQQVVKLFWQRLWTILIININNSVTNFNFCLLRHFA